MLITAGIYAISLFATLSSALFFVSLIFTVICIVFLKRNLFPAKYIVIWVLIFYFGIINTSVRLKATDDLLNMAPINSEISGTIVSIPQGKNEGRVKFFFDAENIKFGSFEKELKNEKVLATVDSTNFDGLKLYNKVLLKGRLSVPFKAGNPSQFDYSNYLRNHNTYSVFYAKEFELLDTHQTIKAKVLSAINSYREYVISLHSRYLPSPNLEILGGIVFGDDAVSPPQNIKDSFVNSGLLHILAASGMNVAFIYGFFFSLMSLFKLPFRLKIILGMIMVVVYTLMTGLGASIIRAASMLLFVLIGKLIDRDAHSISLLSFVGLLMLIYNPLFINDVGFQLSFVVTFGLLVMTPVIVRFNNKVLNFIVSTVSIPVIAQLWVIPIQIFYFNNISLYSVFANIMSVPIIMVLSFGGFISSLLAAIRPIADFICKIFDFVLNPLTSLLIKVSDFWGSLPNASIQTSHPSVFQILVYYLILLCISGLLYKEFREKYLKNILRILALAFIILLITLIPIKDSSLQIITFDVGNADAFLIKTPKNEYMMIDTGKSGYKGGKSQASLIIIKYLKDRGINNLDKVIVTHFDNDHCGGAVDLLESLKVNEIYLNTLAHESIAAKAIYEKAKLKNTKVIMAENNQEIYNKSDLVITNLLASYSDNDNESSIMTLIKYNNFTMLFTGDINKKGLNSILNQLPRNITVLKVPHHGAVDGLDNKIVSYLNPKFSILSVGENKFGHPSLYTLGLLNSSKILRTDIHNSILIRVNRKKYKVYKYNSTRRKYIHSY